MAAKKASAGNRAQQFLASVGTAGGAIGSPGLVSFGASDLYQQATAGNLDEYRYIRQVNSGVIAGQTGAPAPAMPQDLDSAYLKLNLPGSILPRLGLLCPQFIDGAQYTQDNIVASEQYAMMRFMPQVGQLPVLPQPIKPTRKGTR